MMTGLSSEEFENDDNLDDTGGDDIVEDDLLYIFQGEVDVASVWMQRRKPDWKL